MRARWRDRVAGLHNTPGLTEVLDPATRPYFGRPFRVLHADRFAAALRSAITDSEIRALSMCGAVDQFADSTDFLGDLRRIRTSVTEA